MYANVYSRAPIVKLRFGSIEGIKSTLSKRELPIKTEKINTKNRNK